MAPRPCPWFATLAVCAWSCTAPNAPGADARTAEATAADTMVDIAQTADTAPVNAAPTDAPMADAASADGPDTDSAPTDAGDTATVDAPPGVVDANPDAVAPVCPVAVVKIVEGNQVVPQTTLHLTADKSYSPIGLGIKKYKWTVKQPAGSNQAMTPNASFGMPAVLAIVVGEYEFCLDVWDSNDVKSCVQACEKVLVIPDNAVHFELIWGPDADLDLHFAHPKASSADLDCDGKPDPWFDDPMDTFWLNLAPSWGDPVNKVDDPSLTLDDTDGFGPENLNLGAPEGTVADPMAYALGVHYWADQGAGSTLATVNLWMQGGLALQFSGVKLEPLDMWYVGRLNWPNSASGGNKKVFDTCYQSGASCPAGKNLMWQAKGDWCITKCYEKKTFVKKGGGVMKPKPAWCP